jgi:hypothetical protein
MSTDVTELLPPTTGVRLVWAMTHGFSRKDGSKPSTDAASDLLKDILSRAGTAADKREAEYVIGASAAMHACFRNIETIYNGRNANFDENNKLRDALQEQMKRAMSFGSEAKDFLKSLPTMTFTGAGGVTLAKLLGRQDWTVWVSGLALAAIGYGIHLLVVGQVGKNKQRLLMLQDYEHTVYYEHYLNRVVRSLASLYTDLCHIHEKVFGKPYDQNTTPAEELVEATLAGTRPTFCEKVHSHMRDGIIDSDQWCHCESGIPDPEHECPLWPERT